MTDEEIDGDLGRKFYNKLGLPISRKEWERLIGDMAYKVIKQEKTPNGNEVSTVWLGLDHSFGKNPKNKIIFETMVFSKRKEKGMFGQMRKKILDERRFGSLEDALRGHKELFLKWSNHA
jgi:hypothetical protein